MVSDRGDRGFYFQFEYAVLEQNVLFPFPLVTAKWIGDLFDKKGCGSNKIFLLITRQFICAPNVRSEKRDAVQTRKKSAISNMVHNLHSEFDPHRHLRRKASVRQYNGAVMILLYFNLWAEHVLLIYNAGIYWRTKQFTPHCLISK
jgi:hypothetical protein